MTTPGGSPASQPDSAADAFSSASENELITIAGGVEIEVTKQDGSKETVKVRQIPISKYQSFVIALSDEATQIELYCDKAKPAQPSEPRWSDTLTFESANAILDKGQKLNLPFLAAWFRRQAKWRESQAVGAIVDLEKKVQEMIKASLSANSPPPSQLSTGSPPDK